MWKELDHPLEMFGPEGGNQQIALDDNKRTNNNKMSTTGDKQRAMI
jgi:hypothetical protein